MLEVLNWFRDEFAVIKRAPATLLSAVIVAGALTWWVADQYYAARVEAADHDRDLYRDCRETGSKAAPCPVIYAGSRVITKTVVKTIDHAVPDPLQSARIAELETQLSAANTHTKRGDAPSKPAASTVGPVSGSGNIVAPGMSGGANTINNFEKPDRVLDDIAKQKLLSMLPSGTKKISIMSVANDYEGAKLAAQINTFLVAKGFDSHIGGVGMYSPTPPVGVIVPTSLDKDGVEQITVGLNNSP